MKLKTNLIFQLAAMLVQLVNEFGSFIPKSLQIWVFLIVGLLQALIAWRAHYFNPDGTRAVEVYEPQSGFLRSFFDPKRED